MKISLLRLALSDLDKIFDFIAKDNAIAATNTIKNIWENIESLREHPNLGRPGRIAGTRELIISKPSYIVPYRVQKNEVQILRVIHTAQDWPKQF